MDVRRHDWAACFGMPMIGEDFRARVIFDGVHVRDRFNIPKPAARGTPVCQPIPDRYSHGGGRIGEQ